MRAFFKGQRYAEAVDFLNHDIYEVVTFNPNPKEEVEVEEPEEKKEKQVKKTTVNFALDLIWSLMRVIKDCFEIPCRTLHSSGKSNYWFAAGYLAIFGKRFYRRAQGD